MKNLINTVPKNLFFTILVIRGYGQTAAFSPIVKAMYCIVTPRECRIALVILAIWS